ncbi:MAG: acyltransferase [Muribaculaceae bacterium]|nr:acyltransferase [Muribaculaceae bacterium]
MKIGKYTPAQYLRAAWGLCLKLGAQLIGLCFYKSCYLKGKEFSSYKYTSGWRWVMECFFIQKVLGYQRHIPFPVSFRMQVMNWENIHFHVDDLSNFQKGGSYFQAASDAHIYIGHGSYIAANVGIITANHDINDLSKAAPGKDVTIGENCWIGMNSVLLPGVTLGPHTVVGAGSVVTKSFPDGNCVIAGNPARLIRTL